MSVPNKIKRAMLVPYQKHQDVYYFLCMRPSDQKFGGASYQFAKGRIEDGESGQDAAVREAFEELGLGLTKLTNVEFVGLVMNGTCELYIGEYDSFSYGFCDETVHTAWLSASEFFAIGRDWQKSIMSTVVHYLDQRK